MFSETGELRVRLVTPADEPFVYELFASVRAPEFDYTDLSAEQKTQLVRGQFHSMHSTYRQRYPNGKHYIVISRGKDVGRIYINETKKELRLLDVIIAPQHRNHGYGSALLKQMIAHAKKRKLVVRFYVWTSNLAAQRLYIRHGFVQVRDDDSYLLFEHDPNAK